MKNNTKIINKYPKWILQCVDNEKIYKIVGIAIFGTLNKVMLEEVEGKDRILVGQRRLNAKYVKVGEY